MAITAFLTDSTLCIGCKACEVACKEWNAVGEDGLNWSGFSYDRAGAVGAQTWRHVKLVEQTPEPAFAGNAPEMNSWAFSSDVCKHCENAGCLEACPTGAIVRTEFGGVFVQPDICNGCGYCVVSCPFGVVERNPEDGRAFKCTFCYDRQKVGLKPACATACPTESINSDCWTKCDWKRKSDWRNWKVGGSPMPASTIRSTPASAAFTLSSCCAAIPRLTI